MSCSLLKPIDQRSRYDHEEVIMNSPNPSSMKKAWPPVSLLAITLMLGTLAAPVAGQITTDNKTDAKSGDKYPEIIAQYQTGADATLKSLSLITTLDTGTECVALTNGPFNKIKNGDITQAKVQIASFAAFTPAFLKEFKDKPVKDSQELKKADYDATKLSKAKQNKISNDTDFDAVGMAFLTMPAGSGKTFVLDPQAISPPKATTKSGIAYPFVYNLAVFEAGDNGIPKSTVNIPATLTKFQDCDTPGADAEGRPLVKGTAEKAGRTVAVVKGILVDTGAQDTVITPDFAQKVTGAAAAPADGTVITLDALMLGQGKDSVVAQNVKVSVSKSNADKRELRVGQNILQKFVTVWKLADATPTIGFTVSKPKAPAPGSPGAPSGGPQGAPASPYLDREFITPGTASVQGRNERQTSFENVVSSGLAEPAYLAIATNGHVLVSDDGQDSVLEFGQDGTLIRIISDPDLQNPQGIAMDSNGALYVSSAANDRVLLFDSNGTKIGEISNNQLQQPKGLALGPDGELFVSSFGTNSILEFDPATGDLLNSFADADLAGPEGLAFTDDGFLFVAGSASNNIMLLDARSPQPTLIAFPTTAPLNGPTGLFAYSGTDKEKSERGPSSDYGLQKLLVANHLGQQILTIGGAGDLLDSVSTPGQPVGVAADFQLVLCDANHDGKIDSADIALIEAALGQQVGPGDPRDPDGDGMITSNDVLICQSFCDSGSACHT